MSPADTLTTSPGTSCLTGISSCCVGVLGDAGVAPFAAGLSTVAVLLTSVFSRSAAWWERYSCQNRSTVDSATMMLIIMAAFSSPVRCDTTASPVSSRLNGLR